MLKQVRPVWSQRTYVPPVQACKVSLRSRPKSHPFLCCVHQGSNARLWYGVDWGWGWGWGVVAAGIEVAMLPPEIWAASVARLLPGPVCPDPVLSFSVEWAKLDRKSVV